MPRHLIDTPRSSPDPASRLNQFLKIARSETPHETTRSLAARMRARADKRTSAYAKIARGHKA